MLKNKCTLLVHDLNLNVQLLRPPWVKVAYVLANDHARLVVLPDEIVNVKMASPLFSSTPAFPYETPG